MVVIIAIASRCVPRASETTSPEAGWPASSVSVAADYLYDQPVMLGSQRIGPDLTNVGLRQPDAAWQFNIFTILNLCHPARPCRRTGFSLKSAS